MKIRQYYLYTISCHKNWLGLWLQTKPAGQERKEKIEGFVHATLVSDLILCHFFTFEAVLAAQARIATYVVP